MPIARSLRHLYRTESWLALVAFLKKRSGNRCEWCGKPNGKEVWTRTGSVQPVEFGADPIALMFWRPSGRDITWRDHEGQVVPPRADAWQLAVRFPLRLIKVVCCGAHLNDVAGDDRPENAAFLCQWCHLHQDGPHHKATRCSKKDPRRPLLVVAS